MDNLNLKDYAEDPEPPDFVFLFRPGRRNRCATGDDVLPVEDVLVSGRPRHEQQDEDLVFQTLDLVTAIMVTKECLIRSRPRSSCHSSKPMPRPSTPPSSRLYEATSACLEARTV